MAYINSRVTFRCAAPNSPPPVIFELIKDGDVMVDTGLASLRNQSVAFSVRVVASSEGSYHCRATAAPPPGGDVHSNSIQLSVVSE